MNEKFEEYIKDLSPELQEKARPKMSFYSLLPMKIWKYLWTHLKALQAAALISSADDDTAPRYGIIQ